MTCGDFAYLGSRLFDKSFVISSSADNKGGHSVLYDSEHTWDFWCNIKLLNYRYPNPCGKDIIKEKIWSDIHTDKKLSNKFYSEDFLKCQNKINVTKITTSKESKMKVYCVRIGDKYGKEYEDYINDKLKKYEVIWIRKPFHNDVTLQWNKMLPMSYDIDEPICVIDIDIHLINDYEKLFDYPIERGQFISIPAWWKDADGYNINGGFFKYYPVDCKYIYDKFISDIDYWQQYYINNKTTVGPVNGEQYFVEDSVNDKLELITVPPAWVTRWSNGYNMTQLQFDDWQYYISNKYINVTNNEYLKLGDFHKDIKFIHFTHAQNKPYK